MNTSVEKKRKKYGLNYSYIQHIFFIVVSKLGYKVTKSSGRFWWKVCAIIYMITRMHWRTMNGRARGFRE